MTRWALFAGILLITAPAQAEALRVIDGDTFVLEGVTIRLWGTDAPEGRQQCRRDGLSWHCGSAALVALEMILAGQTVECARRDVDRYGRVVASCTISNGQLDVGTLMVGQGWALDYTKYSNGFYAEAQSAAQADRLGLWSSEFEPPWEWRKTH